MGIFKRSRNGEKKEAIMDKVAQGEKFVFMAGGSGAMAGVSLMHIIEALKMLPDEQTIRLHSIFETMDQGGKVIEQLDKLNSFEDIWGSISITHRTLKLADRIKSTFGVQGKFSLKTLYPEWEKEMPFLTKTVAELDLSKGFYQQMGLGAYLVPTMMECAMKSKEDEECGYRAVAECVCKASDGSYVMVVFMGSLFGGEGRTILSDMPARLFDYCVDVCCKENNSSVEQAEQMVRSHLKMAEIQIGGCYRYPKTDSAILRDDVSDLSAGALRNFPERTEGLLDRIYYFDSNSVFCPVQAEIAQEGAQGKNHHHEVELLMVAAAMDFFKTDFGKDKGRVDEKKGKIRIHRYCVPSNAGSDVVPITTWDTLALPDNYRKALLTRLRFDAGLLLNVRPQIYYDGRLVGTESYENSYFISRLYGATGKKLSKKIDKGEIKIDDITRTVKRVAALIEREEMYVKWLYDIAVTGKDWQQPTNASSDRSELVNIHELRRLIVGDDDPNTYNLDELTNVSSGNIAHTGKTVYDIMNVAFNKSGRPRDVVDIFHDIYKNCMY